FGKWALRKSKAWLYAEGQRRHVPVAAIQTPADLVSSQQLAARGYFVDVQHPATAKALHMPGAPYRLTATPWRLKGAAPTLGQDNDTILAELDLPLQRAAERRTSEYQTL